MDTKELSEAAVEFNCILKHFSKDIIKKIPNDLTTFLKEIESKTYKFKFDKRKKLKEQNLKLETRGLIALVYRDYLCNQEERIKYQKKCREHIMKKELEKIEKYNPDNIFKKQQFIEKPAQDNIQIIETKKENVFKRIFLKLKMFFKKQ